MLAALLLAIIASVPACRARVGSLWAGAAAVVHTLREMPSRRLWQLLGSAALAAVLEQPQYVCMNKMYGCTTQPGCWNENVPASLTQASVDLLLSSLGGARGSASRRLCLGWQINVLDGASAPATKLASLDNLLALAEANDLPVLVSVDPFEFWTGAPQLWNFWNSSMPGYDPANRLNVEWTGPSPANATAISWCDWGSQFRKPPGPNLASAAFRAAAAAAMQPLLARLAAWHASLAPARRQYLLAGVKPSWEAWIGTNYFFYPGGNTLVNADPARDPRAGVAASAQVGYAAACTAAGGSGCPAAGALTLAQLDGALTDYLAFVSRLAAAAGLPRHKIITHAGTYYGAPPTAALVFNSPAAAVTREAKPGWSCYSNAHDPRAGAGLDAALDAISGAPWGATEWLYEGGNAGTPLQQWLAAFNNTLSYRNNRLVAVYNWESAPPVALSAAQLVLAAAPACLVDSASRLSAARLNASHVRLSWAPGAAADAQLLAVGAAAATDATGGLAVADVAAATLAGGGAQLDVPVAPRLFYWTVVSRGCGAAPPLLQLAASAVAEAQV